MSDQLTETCQHLKNRPMVGLPTMLSFDFNISGHGDSNLKVFETIDDAEDCPNTHFWCPEGNDSRIFVLSFSSLN